MSKWKECKIGDISEVLGGGTPSTKINEYWGGEIPWLTPRDLTNHKSVQISKGERSITKVGLDKSSARLLPKGTVLLTSRAPIGYVAIATNPISTNQGFKNLIPKEGISLGLFLYYWLKDNKEYLEANGSGTTFSEISGTVVKLLDISLPPLPEQKAIAEVLSSLDDKIDLLHRQNETLDKMAETLFRKWFVEDTDDSWEVVLITDIFEVRDGTHDSPKKKEIGNKLITSKHLKQNYIDFESAYYISEEDYENINRRSKVETKDILFSMIGTIGNIFIEESETIDYAIKNVGLFKTSSNHQWCYFTYLWLKSSLGQEFIHENRSGSTQEYISLGGLRSIEFLVPSISKVADFDKEVTTYFSKIKSNQNQIRTLEKLRDTLLPKLISGKVRVEGV